MYNASLMTFKQQRVSKAVSDNKNNILLKFPAFLLTLIVLNAIIKAIHFIIATNLLICYETHPGKHLKHH